MSSVTPSSSVSFWLSAQPRLSTDSPLRVSGHWSMSSVTPSSSVSFWLSEHPEASTDSPRGVLGQISASLNTPSPSSSFWLLEHPEASTDSPKGVLGQRSNRSGTPSLSVSDCSSNTATNDSPGTTLGKGPLLITALVPEELPSEVHSTNCQPAADTAVNVKTSDGSLGISIVQHPEGYCAVHCSSGSPGWSMVTEPDPCTDTFIPPIDKVWPLTDALSIRAQSATKKLFARNKVKISYRVTCAFDGLELHVQRAGV